MCDCKCVVLELMPEYHKDWTVDETDVLFEWFKAYELEIRTALEQAQKVEGLVEVAAELLWQRDYPNGGTIYNFTIKNFIGKKYCYGLNFARQEC